MEKKHEQFKGQPRLPKFAVPKRYDLKLKPNLIECKFTGNVEIDVDIKSETKFLVLNASELVFDLASVWFKSHSSNKEIRPLAVDLVEEDEIVVFEFADALPLNEGTLGIGFDGILNDRMKGFYRSSYEINGEKKNMAVTQFEPADARRCFPCWDEPAAKIRDFHIAEKDEDIGYYAGYVGSAYMFGRALTSLLWGMIADRYGRKPVIIIGTISVVVFNALFGLSTSFWMAISMRFLLGSLSGVLVPIKAFACEVCRIEYQALALSVISTAWGVGLIVGPALGGFLALPAEKHPNIFHKGSLFDKFPYFLPCLSISVFASIVTVSCLWLPETLHKHNGKNEANRNDVKENAMESGPIVLDSKKSLLKNWPLMSSIIVYCVFSLHDMAYTEIFSLWAVSPRKLGGLSFTTVKVGETLSITGAGLLLSQVLIYPRMERILGYLRVSRISAALTVPLLSSYPLIAKLSGLRLLLILSSACILKSAFSSSIVTGLFILQNNAVPQHQRGSANGISMTAMSLFKAFGPAGGGALFSWAQKRTGASFLPGTQMVFFSLNVIEVIGFLMTFKPFMALPPPPGS